MLQICYSGNAKHSGKVAYLPMSDLWSISTPPKNIAKSLILIFSDSFEREHWHEMGYQPIFSQCTLSLPHENIRKP